MSKINAIRLEFIIMLVIALLLEYGYWNGWDYIRSINLPLRYVGVLFHELGHAIVSLVEGRGVYQIKMVFEGGGVTLCNIDNNVYILFAGYFMTSLVGAILFYFLSKSFDDTIEFIPYVLVGIIALTGLFFVRDFITLIIMLIMWGIIRAVTFIENTREVRWFLKFLAIYLMISGMTSSYEFAKHEMEEITIAGISLMWDGGKLAEITGTKEQLWIKIWAYCSIFALIISWIFQEKYAKKYNYKNPDDFE